jgi:lipoate-protein ligase B
VLALQRRLHARVAAGIERDTWIVVEHDPVVTLGRTAKRANLLLAPERLNALGIDVVEVERGGDVTYHGPGQLVVYPIVKLPQFREVAPLVSALERSVTRALDQFGVCAGTRSEHRGVYVGTNAICAIGLSVKGMTSMHGLALNVSTPLDYDRWITPCGTPEFGITSLSHELDRNVPLEESKAVLLTALAQTFELAWEAQCDQVAS